MKKENSDLPRNEALNIGVVSRSWWNMLSEDDQIWKMMVYGFEKFNPKNITTQQVQKIYELEHS